MSSMQRLQAGASEYLFPEVWSAPRLISTQCTDVPHDCWFADKTEPGEFEGSTWMLCCVTHLTSEYQSIAVQIWATM